MALEDESIPGARPEDYEPDPPQPEQPPAPAPVQPKRKKPALPSLDLADPSAVGSNMTKLVNYGRELDDYRVGVKRDTHNATARQAAKETGAQFQEDESGTLQPVIDPQTGRQRFTPGKSPVRYTEKTGKPYRIERDETGAQRVTDPDANADYGPNPDDPNDRTLYKRNRLQPWEPIDPEQGIHSPDKRLAVASAKFLHGRELGDVTRQREDIELRLRDPARSRALTEKERATAQQRLEALKEPEAQPEPVRGMFGGVNQAATDEATGAWQQREAARVASLDAARKSVADDDERRDLETQSFSLAKRHKELRDAGPAGILKLRRAQAAAQPADIEAGVQAVRQQDQQNAATAEQLQQRAGELDAETSRGVTADRAAEIQAERMELGRQIEGLTASVAQRNDTAQGIQQQAAAAREKSRQETKAARDKWRKDASLAPIADRMDALDAEAEQRRTKVEQMPEGPARQVAADALDADLKQRHDAIQGDYGNIVKSRKVADAALTAQARELMAAVDEDTANDRDYGGSDYNTNQSYAIAGKKTKAQQTIERIGTLPNQDAIIGRADELRNDDRKLMFNGGEGYAVLHDGNLAINPMAFQPEGVRPAGMQQWDAQIDEAVKSGAVPAAQADALKKHYEKQATILREATIDETLINSDFKRFLKREAPDLARVLNGDATNEQRAQQRVKAAEFLKQTPGVMQWIGDKFNRFYNAAIPQMVGGVVEAAGIITGGDEGNPVSRFLMEEAGNIKAQMEQDRDPRLRDSAWGTAADVAGSVAGFALPGAAIGRAARLAGLSERAAVTLQTVTIATTGAAQNASQVYDEARDAGLSHTQSLLPFVLGGIVGASEIVPISRVLVRAGRPVSSAFWKAAGHALAEMTEEAGQEAFQQISNNAIAQNFYDKNRGLFDRVLENAGWGAGAGAVMSLLATAAGRMKAGRLRRKYQVPAQWSGPLEDLAAADHEISQIQAVPTLEQLNARRDALVQGLQQNPAMAGQIRGQIVGLNQTIRNFSRVEPAKLPPQNRGDLATALTKIATGAKLAGLPEAERHVLTSAKTEAGVPFLTEERGQPILTDTAREWLSVVAPHAADLITMNEAQARSRAATLPENGKTQSKDVQTSTPAPQQQGAPAGAPRQDAGAGGANRPTAANPAGGVASSTEPPIPRPEIRPLTGTEAKRVKQLSRLLQNDGAGAEPAEAFARQFVRDRGAEDEFETQRAGVRQAWEQAGGKEREADIHLAIRQQETLHGKTIGQLATDAETTYTRETGKKINPEQGNALRVALNHLVPAVQRWNDAFRRVTWEDLGPAPGGMAASNGDTLQFSLPDLLTPANLRALITHPQRAERAIAEEAIHIKGRHILAARGRAEGITREQIAKFVGAERAKKVGKELSDEDLADAMAGRIFQSLPAELRQHVESVYSEKPGTHEAWTLGHEFLRMLVQHDLEIADGRVVDAEGHALSEQTLDRGTVQSILDYLRGLLSWFGNLAKRLRGAGADEKTVAEIESVREELVDAVKNLRKQVEQRRDETYRADYAGQTSKGTDTGRGKGVPRGTSETGVSPAPRGDEKATVPDLSRGGDAGEAAPARPELEAENARMRADLERRTSEEERRRERLDKATAIRAEATADKDKILARVPEDAKAQATAVLDRMQMGAPTYVLGANRERLPAAYVALPPGAVQTSHVGRTFAKNPLYGGENTRAYHSDETEQAKVNGMAMAGALDEDEMVTDAKSAAAGSPQVVLAIFNDTEGRLQVQVQTAGGNGREQGVNLAPAEDQDRLAEAWRTRGGNFGLANLPDGWRGYRFLGVYDLRNEAQNREYLNLVDRLNPNQSVVQDTATRADIDAALNVPVARLVGLPLTMAPEEARAALVGLVRDSEKLGLDRNLMAGLVKNPGQAQFYMQRLLIAAAFRNKALGEFFTASQWAPGHATVSGLIKAATSTALRLREKGQGNIADAIGRTLERVAEYAKAGDKIGKAIARAADQAEMGEDGPTINALADALVRKIEYFPVNKRGIKPVDSEETISGFEDLMRDVARAIEHATTEPDLLGPAPTAGEVLRRAIDAHFGKVGIAARGASQTDTSEFKAWFGDSKVVDGAGNPIVVFHATGSKVPVQVFERGKVLGGEARFFKATAKKASGGMSFALEGLSPGWFTDNREQYKHWHGDDPAKLTEAYIKLETPVIIEADPLAQEAMMAEKRKYAALLAKSEDPNGYGIRGKEFEEFKRLKKKWRLGGTSFDRYEDPFAQLENMAKIAEQDFPDLVPGAALREALKRDGHDGVILRQTVADTGNANPQRNDWFIPFDGGSQIKSATGNSGAFDRNNSNILAARGAGPSLPRRIRQLQRKRQEEGLNRYESDELAGLERHAGQGFLSVFDAARDDRFSLDREFDTPSPITTGGRQMALLARAAAPGDRRQVAAWNLLEKSVKRGQLETYEEGGDENRNPTESPGPAAGTRETAQPQRPGRGREVAGDRAPGDREIRDGGRVLAALAARDSQGRDERIVATFGEDWPHGYDQFGLPELPLVVEDGHPLLQETDWKETAVLTPDSLAVKLLGVQPGPVKRTTLRNAIVDYFLAGGRKKLPLAQVEKPQAQERPVAIFMGGGGGAGKSSILDREVAHGNLREEGTVLRNPDEVREFLPEYDALNDVDDPRSSRVTHEEAAALAAEIERLAVQRKLPLIIDGTMKHAQGGVLRMRDMRAAGYEVKLLAVTIDPQEALIRSYLRGRQSKRFVPREILLEAHRGFNAALPAYIRFLGADAVTIYDNSPRFPIHLSADDVLSGRFTAIAERAQGTGLAARRARDNADQFDLFAAPPEAVQAYVEAVQAEGLTDPVEVAAAARHDLGLSSEQADLFGNRLNQPNYKRRSTTSHESRRPQTDRRHAARPADSTAMDDLFSIVARQREAERGAAVDGGIGGGDAAASGRPDVAIPTADRGKEQDGAGGGGDAGVSRVGGIDDGRRGATADGRGEADREGDRGEGARRVERPSAGSPGRNFTITPDTELSPRGLRAKLRANLDAITTLKSLEAAGAGATAEQKAVLSRYSGWGALSQAFDDDRADRIARGEIDQRRQTAARYRGYGAAEYYAAEAARQEADAQKLENWRDQWGETHRQLVETLTPEEYRAAKRSTINAHYTSPEIIAGMWDIARTLGFRGGNILEPAFGAGHFYGLMPEEIADRSETHAVELDSLTGRIAKLLYPETRVQVTGFQNADIADNSIDLAISNVPFADVPVTDAAISAMGGPVDNLHDYFFGKTMTKLRPGGLAIYITSAFTMDKGASENRRWLAERADLVAAFRLPNDAFKANAGTEVVTDIIVLRKKDGTRFEAAQDWTTLADAQTRKGETLRINQYFAAHPQNVLGLLDNDGNLYGDEPALNVHSDPTRPAKVALQQALATLPANIAGEGNGAAVRTSAEAGTVKMGSIQQRDGKFFIQGQDAPPEALNDPKNAKRVRGFLAVRDALNRQYELELSPDSTAGDIETNRRLLNQHYDRFTGEFRDFHDRRNKALFTDDPDFFRVVGAEIPEKMAGGIAAVVAAVKGRVRQGYRKADIFHKRVLEPRVEPTRADSLADAFGISLGWRGRVDPEFIAGLTGQTREQAERALVEQEIAVRDPETGQILSREQYLAGNVRRKLEVARAAGPDYARNARMLESVQPERVGIEEIRFKLGATWIPADVIERFMASMGIQGLRVVYHSGGVAGGNDYWEIDNKKARLAGVGYKDFQTTKVGAVELLDSLLNFKRIALYDTVDKKEVFDAAGTTAAQEAAKKLNAQFVQWVRGSEEIGPQLADIYNREVNSHAQRTYDGQFLTFPWASKDFDIFPDKKNVVWRAIQDGFGLVAHGVGGGKTIVGTSMALELRRLGMARKPMIVVHNATLEQFADTIAQIAPTARVLVGRKDELGGDKRREFLMRIAAGDWDAVVVAHSTFGLIEDDPEYVRQHMQSLIDEIMASLKESGFDDIEEAKKEGRKDRSVKDRVKAVERLEAKIEQMAERRTDTGLLNFQQLGVDALIVDEAHAFKKMPFATKLDVKGIDSGFSARGYAMLMRARSIQERMGGKNVFTMTGTPVTNTLGEVWNMVRLVAPHLLEEYGVEHFDQFVSKFAEVETTSEMTPSGEFKMVERLAKVINLPEWATFFRLAADVRFGDAMVVKGRPGIKGGKPDLVAVERTPGVASWVKYIRQVLAGFVDLGHDDFKENPGLIAIPVQAYMASRAAAIDIRLINPRAKDEPGSKVNEMLDRAMEIYRRTTDYSGTQVIFADSYREVKTSLFSHVVSPAALKLDLDTNKEPGGGFNLYEDIRAKLIARGVPESEIAIISDSKFDNEKRRKALFDDVNAGRVRIVMGSTQKLGTGVNMQRLMAAAHHLDVPWTPADLEQRDGRVYRQGNIHGEMGVDVELLRYGMKDSLDAALWQKLETKQRFITLSLSGKIVGRELEEVDEILSLAEQRAILSGPYGQQEFELQNRLRELGASREGHDAQVVARRQEVLSAQAALSQGEAQITGRKPSLDRMRDLAGRIEADGVQVAVDGRTFDTRKAVTEAVDAALEKARNGIALTADGKAPVVPPLRGITVNGVSVTLGAQVGIAQVWDDEAQKTRMEPRVSFELLADESDPTRDLDFGRVTSAGTLFARLEELSDTVGSIEQAQENNLARVRQLAAMPQVGAWPQEAEYDEVRAKLDEIREKVAAEKAERKTDAPLAVRAARDPVADRAQAEADGALTPLARMQLTTGVLTKIVNSYGVTTPGFDRDEAMQRGRIALARAAREFDAARGKPFAALAGTAVENAMRDLFRQQVRQTSRFPTTLDEPIDESGTETRQDFTPDTATPAPTQQAVTREARRVLDEVIAELPEKMQRVVRGYFDYREGNEVAREIGVTPQAVNQLRNAAFARLRGKLGERGVRDTAALLTRAPRESAPSEDDDLAALLRELEADGTLDHQAIDDFESASLAEDAAGARVRTVGRPDLAHGADSRETRAVDAFYTQNFAPEDEAQWQDEGERMVAGDFEGTRRAIERAGLTGQGISPAQTKAADLIAQALRQRMMESGTQESRKDFNVFWYAYRGTGTAAGRALASRRDPFKTPAERYRDMLIDLITKPRPAAQKEIDEATTPEEKARLIDRESQALLDKLKAAGISVDDILKDRVTLRLADQIILDEYIGLLARAAAGDKDARKRAFRMILRNKGFADIAARTGLKEDEVRRLKSDFVAKMRQQHFAKFKAGAKADADIRIGGTPVDDAAAEAEFKKWLKGLGIVDDAKQGRPKFDIEDPAHVMRMARAIQAATRADVWDMVYEAWIMNILSGPQTQVANVGGNALSMAWDMSVQRGMEAMVNLALRDRQGAQVGEFRHLAQGLVPGMAKAWSAGARAWSAEHDFFEHSALGTPLEIDAFDKGGNVRAAIPGKVGRLVRIPGRGLLFFDSFFKTLTGQMEVGAFAYRIAKAEGRRGAALQKRVEQLGKTREQVIAEYLPRAKPDEEMVEFFARQMARKDKSLDVDGLVADRTSQAWEMAREQTAFDMARKAGWTDAAWRQAVEKARVNTFQQDLKTTAEGGNVIEDAAARLQTARATNKLIGFFFPFVRTPFNIFRIATRKSVFGTANLAWQVGRGLYGLKDGKPYLTTHPELVRDLSEQLIAWSALALLWGAAQGDPDDEDKPVLITGSMPYNLTKKGERELQQRAYGGDYVIRIGGRNGWSIHYGRYEPIATVLGTTIDTIRAIKSRGASVDSMDALWGYFMAQAQSKTFLQGFADIAQGLEGSKSPFEGAKKAFFTALVPNIVRQPLRNLDEHVRDTRHAPAAYTMFPLGDLAEPKANLYGEDIRKTGNPLLRVFLTTPLAADTHLADADRLLLNWNRQNPSEAWAPESPRDSFQRDGQTVAMDGPQFRRFSVLAGRLLAANLRGRFTSAQIAKPTQDDIDAIRSAMQDARDEAKVRIFPLGAPAAAR